MIDALDTQADLAHLSNTDGVCRLEGQVKTYVQAVELDFGLVLDSHRKDPHHRSG